MKKAEASGRTKKARALPISRGRGGGGAERGARAREAVAREENDRKLLKGKPQGRAKQGLAEARNRVGKKGSRVAGKIAAGSGAEGHVGNAARGAAEGKIEGLGKGTKRYPSDAIPKAKAPLADPARRAAQGRTRGWGKESKRTRAFVGAGTAASASPGGGTGREGTGSAAIEEGSARKARAFGSTREMVLGVLLVAATGCLLWVYTFTGVLNVREVVVRGNERLDASFLRTLSGITSETHLLKMDVKAVERALLTEPYVESVKVSRHFPATVSLDVKERKPVGYVRQNGRFALVAVDGMVLESVGQAPLALAEIKVAGMPLLLPGTRLESERSLQVASLLSSMDESLATQVSAAGCSGDMLYLEARGTRVLYGDLSELERKHSIACLALAEFVERYGAVEYIDVSFPDRPVIKPVAKEEGERLEVP